jgi:hypothetical protein
MVLAERFVTSSEDQVPGAPWAVIGWIKIPRCSELRPATRRVGKPTTALVSCPMQNAPILLVETELTFFVLPPVQLCAS